MRDNRSIFPISILLVGIGVMGYSIYNWSKKCKKSRLEGWNGICTDTKGFKKSKNKGSI